MRCYVHARSADVIVAEVLPIAAPLVRGGALLAQALAEEPPVAGADVVRELARLAAEQAAADAAATGEHGRGVGRGGAAGGLGAVGKAAPTPPNPPKAAPTPPNPRRIKSRNTPALVTDSPAAPPTLSLNSFTNPSSLSASATDNRNVTNI